MQHFKVLFLLFLSQGICFAQGTLDESLSQELNEHPNNKFDVLVLLNERVDFELLAFDIYSSNLLVAERPKKVLTTLKEVAATTQRPLIDFIDVWNYTHPNNITNLVTRFHIINAIRIEASADFLEQLAYFSQVEFIMSASKYNVHGIHPISMIEDNSRSVGGIEPGLELIGAPFMWNLGYTGLNRKLYTVDTGVWPIHPAIADNWAGNHLPVNQVWYGFDSEQPGDKPNAHGTHVTGTVLGMDPNTNDTIGVAFNAHFIATDPIVQDAADIKPLPVILESFQFALNPDGDESTSDDVPDVICNSWGIGDSIAEGLCTAPFIVDLYAALDLAGIAVEHSAGNEGPTEGSISLPQYVTLDSLNIFTVGALDAANPNYTIASFSSRGPTSCDVQDSWKIKPEVSAPGVNVRSSVQFDQYALYSGTSMAGPHVAGAVLLLKEAFPYLSGRDILNALYQSAIDLGQEGEDNTYGRGLINLENAYNFLTETHEPVPPNTSPIDIELASILKEEFTCSGFQPIDIVLRNTGSQAITEGGLITLWLDGQLQDPVLFEENIGVGEELVLTLGNYDLMPGNHELYATVELNSAQEERVFLNNSRTIYIKALMNRDLPFGESFEFNDLNGNDLVIYNPDFAQTWDTISTAGLSDSRYSARMRFFGYSSVKQLDGILLPALNVPNERDSLIIKFDYAYRFRSNNFSDSLKVEWSDDCGANWHVAFYKGGEQLSTLDSTWTLFKPISSSHWESFKIDINDEFQGSELLVKFTSINDAGSLLYIDNIGVYTDEDPTSELLINPLRISLQPNPVEETLQVLNPRGYQKAQVTMYDVMGRLVFSGNPADNSKMFFLDVTSFRKGIYFLNIQSEGKKISEKVVVQ